MRSVVENPFHPFSPLFLALFKNSSPYIIYNKVKAVLCIDINQERIKNAWKKWFFLGKVLVVQKKSRTFAPANQEQHLNSTKRKSSLKDLHGQKYYKNREQKCSWVKRNKPFQFLINRKKKSWIVVLRQSKVERDFLQGSEQREIMKACFHFRVARESRIIFLS